jgi:hypothetical protein
MNERFTFRHRDADEAFARPLLAVVPNHPDVAAVPNRYRDDSPLRQRGFCAFERRVGNKWAQAIFSVNAQDRIRSPNVIGIDIDADKAFLDASG